MEIDLSELLKNRLILTLPHVDMPDGPTWDDRVRRAQFIRDCVVEKEEELLDHKMALITKIKRKLLELNMEVEIKLDTIKIKSSNGLEKDEIIKIISKMQSAPVP